MADPSVSPDALSALRPGDSVGPYRLAARIGAGVVGTVWRAEAGDATVALKVVPTGRPGRAAALLTEVRAASRLDHPGVARILDLGEGELPGMGPAAWIVSELCAGTVEALPRPLAWATVRDLLHQVLRALAHAHARGVVHRDLKPANVLFRPAGGGRAYRITDFGIADLGRVEDDEPEAASVGTPLYMAPEQVGARWRDQGPWTDLYALGCMVHGLVGTHPLRNLRSREILERQARGGMPALAPAIEVPDGLVAWTTRLHHPDPAARFRRAAEALAALVAIDPVAPPARRDPEPPLVRGAGRTLLPLRRTRMCGREAELARVRAALDGAGLRTVLITGAPGLGKSSLARAACEALHEDVGAAVLRASWSAGGGPHDGLAALIERDLRSADLDADELIARLTPRVGEGGARDLAALLRPEVDLGVRLGGPAARLGAVRRYVAAVAAERRVVLWLDDLHLGVEGQDLVRFLRAHPLDLGVVATAGEPVELPDAERVELGPLAESAVQGLLTSLLDLSPHAAARVAEHAGGHPSFAVHLLHDLVRRDGLAAGPLGWDLAAEVRASADLRAAWAARVEAALGAEDPRALEVLAVLGVRVSRPEWQGACVRAGVADAVPRLEERALRAGLLARSGRDEVAFAHGTVREILRASATASGRLAVLADACVAGIDERRDPLRRARLLALGSDRSAASIALRRAAILLGQHGRSREALGVLDEHEAIRPPDDRRARAEALVIRSRLALVIADAAGARAAADEADALAVASGWDDVRADALCALSGVFKVRGDPSGAAARAAEARALFERRGDRIGRARAAALLADVEPDAVRALALAEEALALFGSTADGSALHAALVLRVANGVRLGGGSLARARELYEQARAAFVALGDRATAAQITSAIATVRHDEGDPAAARATMDEALALAAEADDPRARAIVEGTAGQLAFARHDDRAAEELARTAADRLHRAGMRLSVSPEFLLAAVQLAAGRRGEARALVDRLRRTHPQPGAQARQLFDVLDLCLTDDPVVFATLLARVREGVGPSPIVPRLLALAVPPALPGAPLRTFDEPSG